MFDKLLSLLPYSPGLVHQMAFYGQRMREEASIRRTGLIFMVLAFMVQFFAVISPPGTTSAATGPSNDLINHGFSSAAEAARDCDTNLQDYKNILDAYGITCKEVANAPVVADFDSASHNGQLFSMGRWPYGLAGERGVNIDGQTYYVRYLNAWGHTTYHALRIIASTGTTYWLLYNCGNIVSVGVPQQVKPQKPPTYKDIPTPAKLKLSKTTQPGYPANGSSVAPGATLGYRVSIDNVGGDIAKDVDLNDTLPKDTSFVSQSLNGGAKVHTYHANSRTVEWSWGSIPPEVGGYVADLKVTVSASAPNGEKICNIAKLTGGGSGGLTSNQVCVTVVKPPTPVTPTKPTPTPTPCQYDTSLPANSPQCKPCQSGTPMDCVIISKTASNDTQNVADANNTTAQPGDNITYTLSAMNTSKTDIEGYVFQENLADVMVYANLLNLHGGTLDPTTGLITWPAVDIAAGATATQQVSVQVKNPVPAQTADPGNPGLYDWTMTNVFGTTVNIHVQTPPAQTISTTSASLPNTGPGAGLIVAGALVMVGGYFYARARLLAKESDLAVKEATVV